MGRRIEEIERPKAVEAMKKGKSENGLAGGRGKPANPRINNPRVCQDESRRTTAKAAAAVGMSRSTGNQADIG